MSKVAEPVGVALVGATRPSAADSTVYAEVLPVSVPMETALTFRVAEPETAETPVEPDRPTGGVDPAGVDPAAGAQQTEPELAGRTVSPVLDDHHRGTARTPPLEDIDRRCTGL